MPKFKIEKKEIEGETWIKFNSSYDKFRYYWGNFLTGILIPILLVLGAVLFYYIFRYVNLIKTNPCSLCENLGYSCLKLIG